MSEDSHDAADRLLDEFYEAFNQLAKNPGIGHKREDLTTRDVLFWRLHSYLIVYREREAIRIVRVLHGKRNIVQILGT